MVQLIELGASACSVPRWSPAKVMAEFGHSFYANLQPMVTWADTHHDDIRKAREAYVANEPYQAL
jgi:DNA-binding HxlR family transcriptional regulator